MNVGQAVSRALTRCELSVTDIDYRDMAKDFLNEIVQEYWHFEKWRFRKANFFFNTTNNVNEYALNKYAESIIKDTFKGTDPKRVLKYLPSEEFKRRFITASDQGDPYIYTDGEMTGVERQVSAASVITFSSSLANYTTGTASVVSGSTRVTFSGATITASMVGRYFRIGSEDKRYRIKRFIRDGSNDKIDLDEPYEEATASSQTYAIGDIQQKGIVMGFDSDGAIVTEEVQLNGTTTVSTTTAFASLIRISKSDRTHGKMTATSNGGVVTNITLDPGETEADFKTIKLYFIPDGEERLEYEANCRHPILYNDVETFLFPVQWHSLLTLDLFIRIKTEFLQESVDQNVIARRERVYERMINSDNDFDEWDVEREYEDEAEQLWAYETNFPNNFPREYWT